MRLNLRHWRWLELAGGIPLLCTMPMQATTWYQVNSLNWIFYILFGIVLAVTWKLAKSFHSSSSLGLKILLTGTAMALIGAGSFSGRSDWLTIGCLIFWWSMFCWSGGWKRAYCFLPAFAILFIGHSSNTFRMNTWLGIPLSWALKVKLMLVVAFCLWLFITLKRHLILSLQSLLFSAGVLAALGLFIYFHSLTLHGHPFTPTITQLTQKTIGRQIPLSPADRRFFITSKIQRLEFFPDNHPPVQLLHVVCGADINEIHPARACLQCAGNTLEADRIYTPWKNFHVMELIGERANTRVLIWVWFSNQTLSTPTPRSFRHYYRADNGWETYQIAIPLTNNNIEEARNALRNLLQPQQH